MPKIMKPGQRHEYLAQPYALAAPHAFSTPIRRDSRVSSHDSLERNSSAWTAEEDAELKELRATNMNWNEIAKHFSPKTGNACRKRHERLMTQARTASLEDVRMEDLGKAYTDCREAMWGMMAERLGLPWHVIEQRCMTRGLRGLLVFSEQPSSQTGISPHLSSHQTSPGYTYTNGSPMNQFDNQVRHLSDSPGLIKRHQKDYTSEPSRALMSSQNNFSASHNLSQAQTAAAGESANSLPPLPQSQSGILASYIPATATYSSSQAYGAYSMPNYQHSTTQQSLNAQNFSANAMASYTSPQVNETFQVPATWHTSRADSFSQTQDQLQDAYSAQNLPGIERMHLPLPGYASFQPHASTPLISPQPVQARSFALTGC